jgi:hypothetical protein
VYNNTTVSETSRMVIVCYWVYSLVCNNTRTGEIGPEHIAGPKCRRTYYNWTEECSSFDDGFSNGGGGGSSYNGGSGGTGGANSINTSPVNNSIEFSETVSNFLQSLSPEQLEYWNGLSTREQKNIVDYLEQPSADVEFVIQFLENSINSGLNLDFKKSLKSPANIDFSEIDKTTIEGQKLDCIYQKLMQSPSFENLFHNTFGGNQTKLNVKFEIANNLPDNIGGVCQLQPTVNGAYTNLIRININHLIGMNAKSNLINARTILHECIHAYLNIKKINCNLGTTIPELNGLDLQSLIGTFYQSFGCHIDVNGSLQSQHDFIFTYLIPSFRNIFSDIYNLLASESNINYVNNTIYNNSLTGENFTWNWNDFFKYYSMEGLHLCDSFVSAIQNVPNENFKYNFYKNEAQNFIKNCQ